MKNPIENIAGRDTYYDNERVGDCSAAPCSTDYAYASIEEFEKIVGYKVNDVFKDGWRMARTTNAMFGILSNDQVEARRK